MNKKTQEFLSKSFELLESLFGIKREIILSQKNKNMKTVILFLLRVTYCLLFQWFTYYVCNGQGSLFFTQQSRVVLNQKARMSCHSVSWLGNAGVYLNDSSSWTIHGNILGADTSSRFFILGKDASLERKIDNVASYVFPVGYFESSSAYRGLTLDMKSLGTTGAARVSVKLIPHITGTIQYEKYFPSNDPSCVAGSWVAFNCLSSDGWHCDGPSDYEYVVSAVAPDYCGGAMKRIIKTSSNSNNWQDSIESVVGSLGESFCEYSNLSGGQYRDFSDFAIASSTSLLPVKFVDVQANALNQKSIRVSWKTEMELNNEKFFIARGTDGSSFKIIGEVSGSGNTSAPNHYFFDDGDVVPNTTYYYMIEQVDYDGAIDWSPIVSAKIEKEEILETKTWNILGQEIPENTPGIQIVQVTTKSGTTCSKVFKPLR